jgi:putative transposase
MARKGRIEFSGALYHVLDRGDRREPIVRRGRDRAAFVQTLGEACERAGWRMHAFVLMSNHYHLLFETPQPNLVAGMRWFQTTWTVRFNRFHHLSGHCFQGRYKAVVVDSEAGGYFATLSDYIHLNPVRAGLIGLEEKLFSYRWSSYPWYATTTGRPAWFEPKRVLGELGVGGLEGGPARLCRKNAEAGGGGTRGQGVHPRRRVAAWLVPGERELSRARFEILGEKQLEARGKRDGCRVAA